MPGLDLHGSVAVLAVRNLPVPDRPSEETAVPHFLRFLVSAHFRRFSDRVRKNARFSRVARQLPSIKITAAGRQQPFYDSSQRNIPSEF